MRNDIIWVKNMHNIPIHVEDNTWVEISHSPREGSFGSLGPMWAYVAPGSGVSVNVGNVLFVDEAAYTLDDIYWLLWMMHKDRNESCALDRYSFTTSFAFHHNRAPSNMMREWYESHDLTVYDTVQHFHHEGKGNGPMKNELILMFACEKHSVFENPLFQCGKFPNLGPCNRSIISPTYVF